MRGWKRAALTLLLLAALAGGAAWLWPEQAERVAAKYGTRQDRAAFERWLGQSADNRREFAEFEAFLKARGVGDVVPAWQLTRGDSSIEAWCAGGAFAVPPRRLWGNVVPLLGLVHGQVVPRVGPVEAVSGWRSPLANKCSRGAKGSKHLTFSGIDFTASRMRDPRSLFASLCALRRELGPASRFGLGAYYDPARPELNRQGRFHVDVEGYRTWGFGYGGESSGCRALGGG